MKISHEAPGKVRHVLLEFTVGNFRSFGEDATFSMVSTDLNARDERLNEENRFRVDDKLTVLRSAMVYGANASGKSNLARALQFMRAFALNSSREGQAGDPILTEPFLLKPEFADEPSFFEVVFRVGETQYRYGFEVDAEEVVGEWLYYLRKREALLFRRDAQGIKLMPEMHADNQFRSLTRSNALLLSVAAQFNNERAVEVLGWFRGLLFLGQPEQDTLAWTARAIMDDPEFAARVGGLVSRLDVGIKGIAGGLRAAGEAELPKGLNGQLIDISTSHDVLDDAGNIVGTVHFDLEKNESGGTQKLVAMAGPLLRALDSGGVLVFDEFDARLHPILSRAVVGLFHGSATNPRGAQLIAFTHDTHLLDRRLLRRDQIWFVEKDAGGQSELYSLASHKVRNDASYERDYLNGRVGAVPYPRRLAEAVMASRG